MSDILIPKIQKKLEDLTPKKDQSSSCSQRSILSLVTYIQSLEFLTYTELKTLKHAMLNKKKVANSALKKSTNKKLRENRKEVGFCEFVIQKQKENVYLTKLVDEECEQQQWKSKTFLDVKLIDSLDKQLPLALSKYTLGSSRVSSRMSTPQRHPNIKEPQSSNKLKRTPTIKSLKKTLQQIYKQKALIFIEDSANIFNFLRLPDWNTFLSGIFAFLNSRRDFLKKILKINSEDKYIFSLYNSDFQLQEIEINPIFEQYEGNLIKYCHPFTCQNGKLEIWNTLLEKILKQYKNEIVPNGGKKILQMLLGLPIEVDLVKNLQKSLYFIEYHIRKNILFGQDKTHCYRIADMKKVYVSESYHMILILDQFNKNLVCNLKFTEMYKQSSQAFKVYIQKLEISHKIAVLFEDFIKTIRSLYVTASIQNLTKLKSQINKNKKILIKVEECQTMIFQIQDIQDETEQVLTFTIYKKNKEKYFEEDQRKLVKSSVFYEILDKGTYKVTSSKGCSFKIFYNNIAMKIIDEH